MFCPQCGTDSPSELRFCRSCGANLKVIGKAVALSEAIARSDHGPLPMLKDLLESPKVKQMTEQVSRAMEQMSQQISQPKAKETPSATRPWWFGGKEKTPRQRREDQMGKGAVTMFSGLGFMVFLYFLSSALALKLPPDVVAQIPFELAPVIRIIWLIGLIPTLAGFGRVMAGLMIKIPPPEALESNETYAALPAASIVGGERIPMPRSIVEHTTELLDEKIPALRR